MANVFLRNVIGQCLFLSGSLLIPYRSGRKQSVSVRLSGTHGGENCRKNLFQRTPAGYVALLACTALIAVNHSVLAAPDNCAISPPLIICSGDQSEGIAYSSQSSLLDLQVESLTTDIRPAENVSGIYLSSTRSTNFKLSFDGSRDVFTMGDNAFGFSIYTKGKHGPYADWTPLGNGDDGGNGGTGGQIDVDNYGNITTGSDSVIADPSAGLFLRSLGGQGGEGGGSGGGSAGDGGKGGSGNTVRVTSNGNITTGSMTVLSENAAGIYARSGGGNGATGGKSTFGAGGDGGTGGNGGSVQVDGSGDIATYGNYSNGIFAISQAGDGGNGRKGNHLGNGGEGGIGGDGGAVLVDGVWSIITKGDDSHGIAAHSMGGTGGNSASGGWINGDGGSGGGSGDGGAVEVNYTATADDSNSIDTAGNDSHGIFAQSIGGFAGSGADGGGVFKSHGGNGGSAGHGGDVTVSNSGIVRTGGERSIALFAESVGGGGGSGGDGSGLFSGESDTGESAAGGNGGVVEVENAGLLQTTGEDSMVIFAQSVGGSGGNAGASSGVWYSVGASGGKGGGWEKCYGPQHG